MSRTPPKKSWADVASSSTTTLARPASGPSTGPSQRSGASPLDRRPSDESKYPDPPPSTTDRSRLASGPSASTSAAPDPSRRGLSYAAAAAPGPPAPRTVPEKPPRTSLPPASSRAAVTPCFDSLKERGYPLGFQSESQFIECMQELCEAAKDDRIEVQEAGVRGSAATYNSMNPNKTGQHFDSRGKGKSDIDAFIVTKSHLNSRPSREGFFHPDKLKEYPALVKWSEDWSKKLGRDIEPAAFISTAPALKEQYIKFTP